MAMTKAEREDLVRLICQRERVLKSAAKQRRDNAKREDCRCDNCGRRARSRVMQNGGGPQQKEVGRQKIEQIDSPQQRRASRAPVVEERGDSARGVRGAARRTLIPATGASAPAPGKAARRRRR